MNHTVGSTTSTSHIALPWQIAGWLAAAAVSVMGMFDLVAEWSAELATTYFVWLGVGIVGWFLTRDRRTDAAVAVPTRHWTAFDSCLAVATGSVAFAVCAVTGFTMGPLPPAYHDEYSYVFGARLILAGRWTWPSSPVQPELFDQMHVLNEGAMASRYYPGTATWIAPWLAAGHPYGGHWFADALAAAMVYGVGRELAGRRCGIVSGLLFAMAMGPALFANLLLAHQPTLVALMLFLWAFVHGMRTGRWLSYWWAGLGLAAAMLCRPATAAAFALPFGVWWMASLARRGMAEIVSRERPSSLAHQVGVMTTMALGTPLVCGWGVMLAYNYAVTGDWLKSPYQLYTDIYTPRHVFGLNNVVRGEQRLGPKVLDEYDRWAENLTPELAWRNLRDRLLMSGLSTIDLPLMALTAVMLIAVCRASDVRWTWLALSIVSLHAVHWAYWYVGIMGWHYVFETAPLWCLACGRLTDLLWRTWRQEKRDLLPVWWCGLIALAWAGMYLDVSEEWPSRWRRACAAIQYPRKKHAEFRQWLNESIGTRPSLVLVDPGTESAHLDYVINEPGLNETLLIGRYRPGKTDLAAVVRDFPERQIYLCRPDRRELHLVRPPTARSDLNPQG